MIQSIADALSERGYATLTPVQEAVTDPALGTSDLLVSAQTGSGKTVGFGLAIAGTLLGEDTRFGPAAAPLALVIAPTRELALQVRNELSWLYAKAGATVISCVGGMDMRDERRALDRGAHVVVATPGRLVDHIKRNNIDMADLRAVVLDEADEMLDLGFREDLEFILGSAPETRRTLMFSATVPPAIAKLAQSFQRDAVRVQTVSDRTQHADIEYRALTVAAHDAENAIINVLRFYDAANAIVFANTRAMVNRLTARFANRGFSVVALSGELSQTERTHALQAMRDGRARVCVATDVAARGIDLPNLELVIHAELPTNTDALLHRSGRTGRAGRKGVSALIVPAKARGKAERLLKTGRITAEWAAPPSADEILRRDEERLLGDPAWTVPVTQAEATFAAKLLDLHGPETIAAAYLRLYRARQSAPEDLSPPDAGAKPRERAPFGPGVWFAMSVGRDARAEARWLLPLLCRAGNISKDDIGAIRIQQDESFVELAEGCVPGFLGAVGPGMTLEDGIAIRRLDAAPDLDRGAARDNRPSPAPRRAPGAAEGRQVDRDEAAAEPPPPAAPAAAAAKPAAKAPATEAERPTPPPAAPAAAPVEPAAPEAPATQAERPTPPAVSAATGDPASGTASPLPDEPAAGDAPEAPRKKERHKAAAKRAAGAAATPAARPAYTARSDRPDAADKPRGDSRPPRRDDGDAPRKGADAGPARRNEGYPPRKGENKGPPRSVGFKRHGEQADKAASARAEGALTEYRGKPQKRDWKKPEPREDKPRPNAADTSKRFTPPGAPASGRAAKAGPAGGRTEAGKPKGKTFAPKSHGSKSHGGKPGGGGRSTGMKSHGPRAGGDGPRGPRAGGGGPPKRKP